jgi:hypothetical protein
MERFIADIKNFTSSITIYIHLLLFVVNNKHKLNKNYDVYSINIIQKFNFHKCLSHLPLHQKGIQSFGISVFNKLQLSIKSLIDSIKQLKSA